jgi:hypothetical protein
MGYCIFLDGDWQIAGEMTAIVTGRVIAPCRLDNASLIFFPTPKIGYPLLDLKCAHQRKLYISQGAVVE